MAGHDGQDQGQAVRLCKARRAIGGWRNGRAICRLPGIPDEYIGRTARRARSGAGSSMLALIPPTSSGASPPPTVTCAKPA